MRAELEDLIAETVVWLIGAAHERGLGSAVILLPDEDDYDDALWRFVAAQPGVVVFGTDPYGFDRGADEDKNRSSVRRWSERTVAATAGLPARAMGWPQAFRVPAGREPELIWGAAEMEAAGIETVAAWAFGGCAAMSGLASADPDAVSSALERAFADDAIGVRRLARHAN
ncbi:MAG: hypothetical protein AVDCRST_MAG73-3225 [uncultured Thermomicrobiales bacterium]|uniref:Uncharacterized protein n=1 Tax=uncultured Thermomicrobiales bacterium TaxID=1645740 RepID=A0A6J4UQ35_9BACT|nr:MAG: hypothetical protein AVDCRST_MAG73-3225 [uncultured Thermomicrobiales bacterium]